MIFSYFHIKLTTSIYHAKFNKHVEFHKNRFQTHENIGLQTNFYKEMYAKKCNPESEEIGKV